MFYYISKIKTSSGIIYHFTFFESILSTSQDEVLASLVAGVFCVTPTLCMSSPKTDCNTMEDQSSGGQGSCKDQCQKGRLLSFCPKAVVSMLQGEMSHLQIFVLL